MIAALWSWAAESWSVMQARAVTTRLIGPRPLPGRVVDLDLVHVLALAEAVLCEHEDNAKRIERLYATHKPHLPPAKGKAREAQITRFLAATGGV